MILQSTSLARRSIRRHTHIALVATLALAFGVGGWAYTTELAGAVVAQGTVVVQSNAKKVQHPTGGVVGEILAREGDRVRSGDVVIRLDQTVTRASLSMVSKNLDELAVRQSRLLAERDGQPEMAMPAELAARAAEAAVLELLHGERRLFEHRLISRNGQRAQLRERIVQLREQIDGLSLQADAKADETALIGNELRGVEQLWRQNLVPITRVMALRREETRLRGERGQLISGIAQARGRISETELQILQIDQDLRSEVANELREVQAKISELFERRIAAQDQLDRIEIRAPQDGVVHQSRVHTVGGVIAAGEAIMLIIPEADELAVEVKVQPQDIDQLLPGQETMLRLSAFNQRTTPELRGKVRLIAADLVTDERTGLQYYPVRIGFAEGELQRLSVGLLPGMPVETFAQTSSRTVLSYLTRPLWDEVSRAFRED